MERRDFLKTSGLAAAAAATACAPKPLQKLPMLVRDPAIVPGREKWQASVCGECSAGCGVQVRIVDPVRAVKLEGNPADPVAGGRLCARGLTSLEALYHPDRLLLAGRRTAAAANQSATGRGALSTATNAVVVSEIGSRLREIAGRNPRGIVAVGRHVGGTDRALLDVFLSALGAPPMVETALFADAGWREAVRRMTGFQGLPWPDFERADLVLAFGAELNGTGPSPVAYARGLSRMRSRSGNPGRLIAISSRFTATAAVADEWLACAPGTEGLVALGIARVLVDERLYDAEFVASRTRGFTAHDSRAGDSRPGFSDLLRQYPLSKVETLSGISAATLTRVARAAAAGRTVSVGGGAASMHRNALGSMMAVLALDGLLGSFGEGGLGLAPPPPFAALGAPVVADAADSCPVTFAERLLSGRPQPIEAVLLVGGANPVYERPDLAPALAALPLLVAVTPMMDESVALAGYVLPEAHALECWVDAVPEPMAGRSMATLGAPALAAAGEARSLGDHLLALARTMGGAVAAGMPWPDAAAALRQRWAPLLNAGATVDSVATTGTWSVAAETEVEFRSATGLFDFSPAPAAPPAAADAPVASGMEAADSETLPHFRPLDLDGRDGEFPLALEVFEIPALGENREAGRPGLAELRHPLTGAMWQAWAELHPATALAAGLRDGGEIVIETLHGRGRFPLRITPWTAPGAVAVVAGGGARALGRFAHSRGDNVWRLAAVDRIRDVPARAWASTRARVPSAEKI